MKIKPIVVGTDGSSSAAAAVTEAIRLARAEGAELHIVSAYRPVPERLCRKEMNEMPHDLEHLVTENHEVRAVLDAAALPAREAGVAVVTHAVRQTPATAVVRTAREVDAATIVVGNYGTEGFGRFVNEPIAKQIRRRAHCDVRVVDTKAFWPVRGRRAARVATA